MKLIHYFFCLLLFYIHTIPASEYMYPVASLCNGETILYIHQNTPTNLELFEWNTITNTTEQILWSIFNPAGLQLLPNNLGFSFIDNGRLRVKLFQRRSPKAIDFDEPLYNINGLHWTDEHSCYCSGQQGDNFKLFQLYDDGSMQCLISENDKDYMYPQKIGDRIFYIERYTNKDTPGAVHYKIINSMYESNQPGLKMAEIIADFNNRPIVFLKMISDTQGFVLEHPQIINNDHPTVLFNYHSLNKQNNVWQKELLFSFKIPTNLLLAGEERLYESLLPLLPQTVNRKIYFAHCGDNKSLTLEPYFYNISTKTIKKITGLIKKQGHYFVPMMCGQKLYVGGTVDHGQKEPLISFLT